MLSKRNLFVVLIFFLLNIGKEMYGSVYGLLDQDISHHLRKLYIEKIINLSGNEEKYLHSLTSFCIFDVRNSRSVYLL